MTEEIIEKAKRELEQIRKMSPDDAATLIRGYHRELLNAMKEAMHKTEALVNLSPNMIVLSETAYVIAEIDRFDKNGCGMLGVVGSDENVAKIINEIIDNSPDVFTELCKLRGVTVQKIA